ncbi:MAG: DNA polymerase III subunit chi [Hyphomicrobiaceae bacterium]
MARSGDTTEILFYHLERAPLDGCCRASWSGHSSGVAGRRPGGVGAADRGARHHLWTYDDRSFLPHGKERDGRVERQPVFLTTGEDNPNGATVRFLVDGATIATPGDYDRVVVLFDGSDPAALEQARAEWKKARAAGHQVTYWQQAASGKWEKRA